MALATKCPHCNTIFRVAADQLKLRGGIVRCGSCHEVFDGNAALVEPAAKPTPLIPDVTPEPHPAAPSISHYVHGAPVDFELDFADEADAPAAPQPATPAPSVWRSGTAAPAPAPAVSEPPLPAAVTATPAPSAADAAALAAVARAFATVTSPPPKATAAQRAPLAPPPAAKPKSHTWHFAQPDDAFLAAVAEERPSLPGNTPVAPEAPANPAKQDTALWDLAQPGEEFLAVVAEEKPAPLGASAAAGEAAAAPEPAPMPALASAGDNTPPPRDATPAAEEPPAPADSGAGWEETIASSPLDQAPPLQDAARAADIEETFPAPEPVERAGPPSPDGASAVAQAPDVPATAATEPNAPPPPGTAPVTAEAAEAMAAEEPPPPDAVSMVAETAGAMTGDELAPPGTSSAVAEPADVMAADEPPLQGIASAVAEQADELPLADSTSAVEEATDTTAANETPAPESAPAVEEAADATVSDETPHPPEAAPAFAPIPVVPAPVEGEPSAQPDITAAEEETAEPAAAPDVPTDTAVALPADDAPPPALRENADPDGRIEPSFETPQERIVIAAHDDTHRFEELPSAKGESAREPTLDEEPWHATGDGSQLPPTGEPWSLSEPEPERDETALHAIAAVNTDAPDDGESLPDDEPAEKRVVSRRERALQRAKARRDAEADIDAGKETPGAGDIAAAPGHAASESVADVPAPIDDEAIARMRALAGADEAEDLDHSDLSFVRRVERSQKYGKAARIAMALGIPLLLAGLALQAATTFRDTLAANYPQLKPTLAAVCLPLGCKVALPAQLDALSIEQGELASMAENTLSFATVLRNRSKIAQAWPHIELTLNDNADKPVLRRVFAPREYLPSQADTERGFGPRSEQSIKLYFELNGLKASGYHISIFYP